MKKVKFEGAFGDQLVGRLELPPDGEPRACALFAHCFTCSKNVFAAVRVSKELAQRGIAVLRFDFTGIGESEGDFAESNFSSNVQDLVAAADFMRTDVGAPELLVGHSFGGAAVLRAAEEIPEVKAVSTIAAPFDPAHLTSLLESAFETLEEEDEVEVTIAGRNFTLRRQFLDDVSAVNSRRYIGELGKPLLIFHSPVDGTVGIENASEIFRAAKHPKSFVSLDGVDHLVTEERDAEFIAGMLASWAERYVGK